MRSFALLAALALTACATSPTYQAAAAVNAQVNAAITYTEDAEQYGRRDVWAVDPASGKGDCEDFALTKVAMLQARGIAAEVGICMGSPYHAVALVQDGPTTWVLDNRQNRDADGQYRSVVVSNADYPCKVWLQPETVARIRAERLI